MTQTLCRYLEGQGWADFLMDTAALLGTSAKSCRFASLSREQRPPWLYFPFQLVCFLEIESDAVGNAIDDPRALSPLNSL